MSKAGWTQNFMYLVAGVFAIAFGFGVATQFTGVVRSQESSQGPGVAVADDPNAIPTIGEVPEGNIADLGTMENLEATPANDIDSVQPSPTATQSGPAAGLPTMPAVAPPLNNDSSAAVGMDASNPQAVDGGEPIDPGQQPVGPADSGDDGMTPSVAPATETTANASLLEGFMDPFDYDPAGKKDPFRPLEADRPAEAGAFEGPFQPLQRFEVDQLELIGIIWNVRAPKAMINDPLGNTHVVVENTRMGRNNGYVAAIREGEVVVVEPFVEDGRMTYSTRLLRMK